MTEDERTVRMAELAQRASRLPQGDLALTALLAEMQALAVLIPAAPQPDSIDRDAEAMFDNMPV